MTGRRRPLPFPSLLAALLLAASLSPAAAHANTGRLLTMDAAEELDGPVLGLQRSAVPIVFGLAIDTSLYADLMLAPNLGLRFAKELPIGPAIVVGVRYTQFVGSGVVSEWVRSKQPVVQKFDTKFAGPSAYALLGYSLGPVGLHVEGRWSDIAEPYTTATAGLQLSLPGTGLSLIGEAGLRFSAYQSFRAAAGLRYQGDHLGFAAGVAYVDLEDPMLPGGKLPVLPTLDLSWTF